MIKGSCLCGAVTFAVQGPLPAPNACHCQQCRKQSGHFWASSDIPNAALHLTSQERLRWYQSSAKVRRGFCRSCGSFLFWDPVEKKEIAVAMGALESPTGTTLTGDIFTAFKGDCFEIADGLPQGAA